MKKDTVEQLPGNPVQPIEKKRQKPQGFYDDAYVNAYCENPKAGKVAALLKAGYCGDYPTQEACRIHKRLQERIKQRTTDIIQSLDMLAAAQLEHILAMNPEEVGYSAMAKFIEQGLNYAGRKPGDVLTIKQDMTKEDRAEAIQQLLQRRDEGKRLNS